MNKKKLNIIYEDKELLVINKPAGLLTIATEKEKINTLYHQAREYIKKQNPKNRIFIVHRLDKDTSGIVIFAKSEKLKHQLQDNWDDLVKDREYHALLWGVPKNLKGEIKNYLKESKTLQVYSSRDTTGKYAHTKYEVLSYNKHYSLVKINIFTGRKNQIRVHMSDLGCPIVGDKKYGLSKGFSRMYLHASKLVLIHPNTNKKMIFESKVPNNFDIILKNDNQNK